MALGDSGRGAAVAGGASQTGVTVLDSLDGAAHPSSPGSGAFPFADIGSDAAQACLWALGGDRRDAVA
eukprot:10288452-Alexandrium_andersonii.AAC.1